MNVIQVKRLIADYIAEVDAQSKAMLESGPEEMLELVDIIEKHYDKMVEMEEAADKLKLCATSRKMVKSYKDLNIKLLEDMVNIINGKD